MIRRESIFGSTFIVTMVLKADQARVKALLTETITLLCKNGLNYRSEFAIEALIGITLDHDDVFLISIKEKIAGGMGMLAKVDSADEEEPQCDFEIDIKASGVDRLQPDETASEQYEDGGVNTENGANCEPRRQRRQQRRWQRRRPRHSYEEGPATSQSGDSTSLPLTDSDMEKVLADANSLQESYTKDGEMAENRGDSGDAPQEKRPHVEEESPTRVKEEMEDGDDVIVIKEELPADCSTLQQTYPMGDMFPPAASFQYTPSSVIPTTSSWSAPASMPLTSPSAGFADPLTPSSHMQQQEPSDVDHAASCFQCNICSRTFGRRNSLNRHVNLHRGIYKYHCEECGKGFSIPSDLQGHMAHHTGVREFRCKICWAEFMYARNLKQHMAKIHKEGTAQ